MKDFIIAIVLFSSLICAIIFNSIFINSQTDKLIRDVENIADIGDEKCIDSINAFSSAWERFRKTAEITISYADLAKVDSLINELYGYEKTGDESGFERARILIKDAIKSFSRLEKISIDSVF